MKLQKIFASFIILMLSVLTLEARDNPFIPTKSYIEKKAEMVDNNSYPFEKVTKSEVREIVVDEMPEKPKVMKKKKMMTDSVVLENGKHTILSFVIIEVNDDTLSITSDNQLIKKFDLNYKNTKKIVFDFKSSKGFYSKKAYLNSDSFKEISIGAHPKEGYFRISISVEDLPSNYDLVYGDNTIEIMKGQM